MTAATTLVGRDESKGRATGGRSLREQAMGGRGSEEESREHQCVRERTLAALKHCYYTAPDKNVFPRYLR